MTDHQTFTTLVEEHHEPLYRHALILTRNRDEAKDLLQDVFVCAFRFYDKFEQGTNFGAWLYRILKNQFINQYRVKQRLPIEKTFRYEGKVKDKINNSRYFSEHQDNFFEWFSDEVTEALAKLPSEQREVLLLADVEGYADYMIAEKFGLNVNTAKTRLFKARNKMRLHLKEYAKEHGLAQGSRRKSGRSRGHNKIRKKNGFSEPETAVENYLPENIGGRL